MGSVSLINGHIDPDVDIYSIGEQISNMLEERYMLNDDDCTWICQPTIFGENGKIEEHYLNKDIEFIMKKNKINDFFIEIIDVYDNPSIDCKCLCVSWIKDGKLDGFNEPLYRY